MAMVFILTVTADGEVAFVGQRREQLDGVAVLRSCHFRPIFPDEPGPLSRGRGILAKLHRLDARREVGNHTSYQFCGANLFLGTPRGGRRTVPMRMPSPSILLLPSLTTRIAITHSFLQRSSFRITNFR